MTTMIEKHIKAVLAALPLTVADSTVPVEFELSPGEHLSLHYDAALIIKSTNRKIIFRFGFGKRNDDPFWVPLCEEWFTHKKTGELTIRHQCLVEGVMESMRAQLSRPWAILAAPRSRKQTNHRQKRIPDPDVHVGGLSFAI